MDVDEHLKELTDVEMEKSGGEGWDVWLLCIASYVGSSKWRAPLGILRFFPILIEIYFYTHAHMQDARPLPR